jgi:hypothetical protein
MLIGSIARPDILQSLGVTHAKHRVPFVARVTMIVTHATIDLAKDEILAMTGVRRNEFPNRFACRGQSGR